MPSATVNYLRGLFGPGVGIKPAEGWTEGEEGVDYIDFTDNYNEIVDMLGDVLDVLITIGLPGTRLSILSLLSPGLLIVPLVWTIAGIEVSLWDLIFIAWLSLILPMPSVSVFGFGLPIPVGLLLYIVTQNCDVPIIGDGTLTLPHSGAATKFGGYTDGKFTFKDLYYDAFLLWLLEKLGKHLGRAAVEIMIRVIIWAAQHQQASPRHILSRITDPNVTLNYAVGYDVKGGEKILFTKLKEFFDEMSTEQDDDIPAKEYIKRIRGDNRL